MVYLCKTLLAAVLLLGLHSQSAEGKCDYPGDVGSMTSIIMGKGIGPGDVPALYAAGVDAQLSSWTPAQITALLMPGTCAAKAETTMDMQTVSFAFFPSLRHFVRLTTPPSPVSMFVQLCSAQACWAKPFNAGFTAASKNINHTPDFFMASCKQCGKPPAAKKAKKAAGGKKKKK